MTPKSDPETLKIPAYMRNKAIVKRDRQKLLWTAWDRREAGVDPGSKQATGRIRRKLSDTPKKINRKKPPEILKSREIIDSFNLKPKKLSCIGETTHYLEKINVAIIKINSPLKTGEILLIEGDEYLFVQPVEEMQIDRKPVNRAKKGSHIGLKVAFEAEVNGSVYKLQ